jgi:8-oxo-dGTP pyrophosphatase MutT (NUDIX family)
MGAGYWLLPDGVDDLPMDDLPVHEPPVHDPPVHDPPERDVTDSDDGPAMRFIARREVYRNPWLVVTEDDIALRDGSPSIYGVVHKPDFAVVIALEGNRLALVEQYRYTVGLRRWELPQGFASGATTPEQAAAIELAEETGLRATSFTTLGFLHHAYGVMTNGFHVVLATGLTQGEPQRERTEQDMRCAWFSLAETWQMIDDGRLTDAPTVAALALLARSGYDETSTRIRPKGAAS